MKNILDILKIHKEPHYLGKDCKFFDSGDFSRIKVQPGSSNCVCLCKYFIKEKDLFIYCDLKK